MSVDTAHANASHAKVNSFFEHGKSPFEALLSIVCSGSYRMIYSKWFEEVHQEIDL